MVPGKDRIDKRVGDQSLGWQEKGRAEVDLEGV